MSRGTRTILTSIRRGRDSLKAFFHSSDINRLSFRIREELLPVLYPRHCPVCGRLLSMGNLICGACRASLPWIREPVCYLCGKPVLSPEQELCYDCRQFPKSFRRGVSLLLYNEVTRPLIADFKYHNKRTLSRYFAEELAKGPLRRLDFKAPAMIVPVPVHKHKRRMRGYNQASLLARDISALTGLPWIPDLLVRTTDTTPQKTLSPQARLDNLRSAFCVNPDYIDPVRFHSRYSFHSHCSGSYNNYLSFNRGSIILVDDIYTTGATLEICTRVLIEAGFADVSVCTICTGVTRD